VRPGHYKAYRGHCIAFPDNAAATCASELPNALFINSQFTVIVEGPEGAVHSPNLEGYLRGLGTLRGDAAVVLDWLIMIHFLNANVAALGPMPNITAIQAAIATTLDTALQHNRLIRLPWTAAIAQAAAVARSDVTRPEPEDSGICPGDADPGQQPGIELQRELPEPLGELEVDGATLLNERYSATSIAEISDKMLQAIAMAVPPVDDIEPELVTGPGAGTRDGPGMQIGAPQQAPGHGRCRCQSRWYQCW